MTKEELRKKPKDFTYVAASNIDLTGIKLLLAFHSLKSEVDVQPIVEQALNLEIKVVFPEDDPYCFQGVILSQIDCPAIMLVPGLAFTKDGKRLGRGKGFYDRSLASVPDCVQTLGICKKSQLLDDIPTENHDKRVQKVLAF